MTLTDYLQDGGTVHLYATLCLFYKTFIPSWLQAHTHTAAALLLPPAAAYASAPGATCSDMDENLEGRDSSIQHGQETDILSPSQPLMGCACQKQRTWCHTGMQNSSPTSCSSQKAPPHTAGAHWEFLNSIVAVNTLTMQCPSIDII